MTNSDYDYLDSILSDLMGSTGVSEDGFITASVDFGKIDEGDSMVEVYAELAALRDRIRENLKPAQYRSSYS